MNKTSKFIYFIITAVVILVTGLLVFIGAERSQRKTQENFEYACQLMNDGNYEAAISYFDKVLEKETDNVDSYLFKAQSLQLLGRDGDAVAAAEFGYKKTKSQKLLDFKDALTADSEILIASQYVVSASDEENMVISGKFENMDGNGSQVTDIYDYSAALNQEVAIPEVTTVSTESSEIPSEGPGNEDGGNSDEKETDPSNGGGETSSAQDATESSAQEITEDSASPDTTEITAPPDTAASEIQTDVTDITSVTQQSDITDITETTTSVSSGYTDEEVQKMLSEAVEYLMKFLEKYWAD